jgi:hypothetical protein
MMEADFNAGDPFFTEDWRFPVFERVRGHVFHRTTCPGLRGILRSGEIRPNINRRFPFSFAKSETSYGVRNNYICLFDFEDTSAEDQIRTFSIWDNLIGQVGKTFFLIILDSTNLREKLISSTSAPQLGEPNYGGCMRPIECWYPVVIPLGFAKRFVIVSHAGPQPEICTFQPCEVMNFLDRFCERI